MHELSVSSAIVDTAVKHAAGRKVTVVTVRIGHLRQLFAAQDARSMADLDDATLAEVMNLYEPEIVRDEDDDEAVTVNGESVTLDDLRERADDALRELPLCVEVRRVLRVDLSTGGPADFFTVEIDEDGSLAGPVRYHFQDWFDGADIRWAALAAVVGIVVFAVHSVRRPAAAIFDVRIFADRNFGMTYSFWDRLFGTADARADEPREYGLPGAALPPSFLRQLAHPFVQLAGATGPATPRVAPPARPEATS